MGKVLVINLDICNGCYNCQIACKDEHVANDWSPIAKPQPDTGQFWNKVYDNVRGQVPKVKVTYEHSICQHCDDAPCLKACPPKRHLQEGRRRRDHRSAEVPRQPVVHGSLPV